MILWGVSKILMAVISLDADFFGDAEIFGEPFNEGRFSCAKVADEGDNPFGGVSKILMAVISLDADLFGDAEPFGETFNKGRFPYAKVADEGDDPSGMSKFVMAVIFQGCGGQRENIVMCLEDGAVASNWTMSWHSSRKW